MNNTTNDPLLSGLERSSDIVGLLNILIHNEEAIVPIMFPVSDVNQDPIHDQGASGEFINNLNDFIVDTEFMKKGLQCSICFEDFKEGDKCIMLPCQEPHTFHNSDDCSVLPWLRRKNNCPMCRCEFPTDTPPTPDQIPDMTYNDIEGIINPRPLTLENTITRIIGQYIRELDETVNEDADLQRAIELSLNDID